ncbi:MAG: HEPN domain-containing protein [Pyrobaculum sp.]
MDLRGVVEREEVEMLRERALMFLAAARDDLRAGREAAFHAEQACQLALKYVLASRVGYYPHTHSLRRLFEEVRAVEPELWSLYERYMFAFEVTPAWGPGICRGGTAEMWRRSWWRYVHRAGA